MPDSFIRLCNTIRCRSFSEQCFHNVGSRIASSVGRLQELYDAGNVVATGYQGLFRLATSPTLLHSDAGQQTVADALAPDRVVQLATFVQIRFDWFAWTTPAYRSILFTEALTQESQIAYAPAAA